MSKPEHAQENLIKSVHSHAHLIHGSTGPHESTSQMLSRFVQQFLQGSAMCPLTITQTHGPQNVSDNRPHLTLCTAAWQLLPDEHCDNNKLPQ